MLYTVLICTGAFLFLVVLCFLVSKMSPPPN